MRKPSLFIVGKARSGSTSLYTYLNQHPDIFLTAQKELFFFCTDFHKESDHYQRKYNYFPIREKKDFLRQFKNWKNEKVAGEVTPVYLYSREAAKNIWAFNPRAKIIMILRNPVDYLYSLHSLFVASLKENEPNFKKALALESQRKKWNSLSKKLRKKYFPTDINFPSNLFYFERIKYTEHIQRYLKYFPAKQVKIIIFDDLVKNPARVYKDLLKFIGVDTSFKPNFSSKGANMTSRFLAVKRLVYSSFILKSPERILPSRIYKAIRHPLRDLHNKMFFNIFYKKAKRKPIDPEFRKELMKKCKPEVIKLSKFLRRDLVKLWGYDKI